MEDRVPAAILPVLVRIDARRPASWLACGMAAAAVAGLAATATGSTAMAAAVACGGWAAAAAAGRPPRGLAPGMVRLDAAWWWERAAWPLGGCLAAAVVRWMLAGDGVAPAVGIAAGIVVMAASGSAAAARGATAADAMSLGLVGATVAAAAGAMGRSAVETLACSGAAAVMMAVIVWSAWRYARGWSWPADEQARSAASFVELGMARGGVRQALSAVAMATSLAGMAVWYFLAPTVAAAGTLAALGWFATLAGPAVLLGPAGRGAWRRLGAATAVPVGLRRPLGLPGAVALACGHAAVLGWPPLVAGLLLTAEGGLDPATPVFWPWLTVAVLAVAAATLVGLSLVASLARVDGETAVAWAACLVILTLMAGLPGLRGLPTAPGKTRVEKMARLER